MMNSISLYDFVLCVFLTITKAIPNKGGMGGIFQFRKSCEGKEGDTWFLAAINVICLRGGSQVVWSVHCVLRVPQPQPADAPDTLFSESRAFVHIKALTEEVDDRQVLKFSPGCFQGYRSA